MGSAKQEIAIQDGLTAEQARDVVRVLKDAKLRKVQTSIQGDTVRVSSASKDELQGVMTLLKQHEFGAELKFGNFRTN